MNYLKTENYKKKTEIITDTIGRLFSFQLNGILQKREII